uniref:Elongation factor G, mitochondrial n=1 Tax=Albugo laibachii Nc14 TaxID=890382 RepID=F0WLH9_9STRA|nr:predicted protein putative [Albugo laibachii Nc14]|eukprot:CCA22142.1 predicted protein putative [Albugo laibachii Nc14]
MRCLFQYTRKRLITTPHGSSLFNSVRASTQRYFCEAAAIRSFAEEDAPADYMSNLRNIGISAHIDSGKTTLTERILYYTGKINSIHDVRGKDGVGAKMDSMELEREKGITIQSAATFCQWKENHINIIDTPGHVDFTIEVERALRVLDGGILVLCGVSGVQSQSLTVDKQMKRYGVPRIAFINKLDRMGANVDKVISDLRTQLKLNACALQIPIGIEHSLEGIIDLVEMKAIRNEGDNGEIVQVSDEIPEGLIEIAARKRTELIEHLANVDEEIGELFLMEEEPDIDQMKNAIRRATIAQQFVPVLMGSAFKNRGVQPLLDAVVSYLPAPADVPNYALDQSKGEEKVLVPCSPKAPLLALAFKLEEGKFGQLTYMRIYSGSLKRGSFIYNMNNMKRIKVPRLVKMHSNEMEDVEQVSAGEVIAMFGVECASMDTFSDSNATKYTLTSLHVPEPVMSLAVTPKDKGQSSNFSKALNRFQREDPTFRVRIDDESKETIISGMGELHLQIYVERMKREYNVEVVTGAPQVNYRETIRQKAEFNHLHRKQSGGSGQFARVAGYIEPLEKSEDNASGIEFVNDIIGNAIPPEYITACEKGMQDAAKKGWLIGHPIQHLRVVLNDGQSHSVDSSEMAFRAAMVQAIRHAFTKANPCILEPTMSVEVEVPSEFQGTAIAEINRRRGLINNTDSDEYGTVIRCDVPLQNMFGFSTDLRSSTQGKGEFSMEYKSHESVPRDVQENLAADYQKELANRHSK